MSARLAILALAISLAAASPAAAAEFRLQTDAGAYTPNIVSWRDMPFRTVVRQRYDMSCGSAAIATLLTHHYGRPIDEARVFTAMYEAGDQAAIRTRGFSLLDMQRYLAGRGLQADGYRLGLSELERTRTPAVAMIETNGFRHFVVIKGVRGGRVLVGDPALGLMIYPRAEFERRWNGIAFVIHGEGVNGAFNVQTEWEARPRAPMGQDPGQRWLEPLTRDLPPLYQLSPVGPAPEARRPARRAGCVGVCNVRRRGMGR